MGPYGPQGPWAHKTKKHLFVSPVGFQTTFLDFGHVKTSLLAPVGFQTTFLGFWKYKNLFWGNH